jgi:hypothetical protein
LASFCSTAVSLSRPHPVRHLSPNVKSHGDGANYQRAMHYSIRPEEE